MGCAILDDILEELGSEDVAIVDAFFMEYSADIAGLVFSPGVGTEKGFHVMTLDHLGSQFVREFTAQVFDAFGEHFAVAHLIEGNELMFMVSSL